MNNINKVKLKCVGCRSCEQSCPKKCISMVTNNEGFLYPRINEDLCVNCGRCLKVCPTENVELHRSEPIEEWAWKSKNEEDVMNSASGGASDCAVKTILNLDGIVYGAAYDKNFNVNHIEVTTDEERKEIQSSKYVQSNLNDCYSKAKEHLLNGKKVLFTGTPCQIAGLYSFLGKEYENLYTIDIICHGVPSPKLFEKYIKWQGEKMGGEVIYYNFRSKLDKGWGTQYYLKTKTKTKTNAVALDKYGKHFLDGDCYRESCYQCPYANTKRVGDLTVGDFWGIDQTYSEFFSKKGVSCIMVNTKKGKELFTQMNELGITQRVTLDDVLIKQGNLVKPTVRPASRDTFYTNIDKDDFMDNLKVGLELKERIKSVIPENALRLLKKMGGGK